MTEDSWLQLGLSAVTFIGAAVSSAIAWFAKTLKDRMDASELAHANELAELKADNKSLHASKELCQSQHAATAIELSSVRATLEQLQNCHLEACPFKPTSNKPTKRIKLRAA